MRHDKQGLVDEAMRTAAAGKMAGDDERMILFSHLAGALSWSRDRTLAALNDVLNHLEEGLETESAEARRLSRRADAILEATKVNLS